MRCSRLVTFDPLTIPCRPAETLMRLVDILDRLSAIYTLVYHLDGSELYWRRGLVGIEIVWPDGEP